LAPMSNTAILAVTALRSGSTNSVHAPPKICVQKHVLTKRAQLLRAGAQVAAS
jgi:hypothetical protein